MIMGVEIDPDMGWLQSSEWGNCKHSGPASLLERVARYLETLRLIGIISALNVVVVVAATARDSSPTQEESCATDVDARKISQIRLPSIHAPHPPGQPRPIASERVCRAHLFIIHSLEALTAQPPSRTTVDRVL